MSTAGEDVRQGHTAVQQRPFVHRWTWQCLLGIQQHLFNMEST
jgi:hypothetical protein